jgi:uncharacterized protein
MAVQQIAAAGLILFLAYFLRAITGFGSALVAVPLLALWLPLSFVVPWIVTLDVLAALALTLAGGCKGKVAWVEIGWLIPAAAVGMVIGSALLVRLPESWLLGVLGILVIVFGLRALLRLQGEAPMSRGWAWPAGALGGAIGALFATGGPPFVIYLSHRLDDKTLLRGTLSALFLLEGSARLATFAATGLLTQNGLGQAVTMGLPLLALGLWLGHRVHLRIAQTQLTRLIGGLLLVSGSLLFWRAF